MTSPKLGERKKERKREACALYQRTIVPLSPIGPMVPWLPLTPCHWWQRSKWKQFQDITRRSSHLLYFLQLIHAESELEKIAGHFIHEAALDVSFLLHLKQEAKKKEGKLRKEWTRRQENCTQIYQLTAQLDLITEELFTHYIMKVCTSN